VTTFAGLLARIHEEVPAIERLRFVTSYPRDFGDDVLDVMAASPRICRYLHAPAQSGSDRILKLMNRGYTRSEYLEFADRVRAALPDASLAGDIIVGFPTETDEDYELTRTLLQRVRFKNNFVFKYSPRPGTTAWDRLPDDVPEEVKRRRINDLLALQATISTQVHRKLVGATVEVFVEGVSRKGTRPAGRVQLGWDPPQPLLQMSGRTGGDLITVFDVPPQVTPETLQGRIVAVRVDAAGPLILYGELVGATT
jgi:tRNA-2-methylthio-N6-dimethylallyladenosine synthase